MSGAVNDDALARAKAMSWYHTLELPDGTVTPGIFDLRGDVDKYGIPADLSGKRVLEVGTWDGFWAFELERRGAEVVALDLDDEADLDWPPRRRPQSHPDVKRGQGFAVAKELFNSNAERVVRSVYHATPEELGTFDLVFCGSVLIHLRDQFLAYERMASMIKPGGMLISTEEYHKRLSWFRRPLKQWMGDREAAVVFWLPNVACWKSMIWSAGMDRVEEHGRFVMEATEGYTVPHVVFHAFKN
jgi:tRNA (mo5U34)-methyltransferase